MKLKKDFFNSVADSWDEMCNHDMKKVEYILDLVDIQAGSRILDVGTGTGVLIPSLYKRVTSSGKIKAIDMAESMIEVAKKKNSYENVFFECNDILKNKGEEAYYDYIICYSMFPHFHCKEEAVEKLSKKLKKGGKLTICHSQSRKAINNLHKRVDNTVKKDNLPNMKILKEYFSESGLEVVEQVDNKDMFVVIGIR
ncbi:class I SAM-dependent methyltransferase [Vallitalea sp.]|jgi:demethylmenaquinone methyltransferase/2-methoxy-6-polyprenyl-1,4-benzoquinol methylase|uniref:class I SAM-dependent methyltransferase n=1 Tax=Vallitalea sp. TaxID=1882829 RepID=UPI0025F451E3|nr:class I SAM-dependent methyltransferase [Vallitalea sp.]MCT4686120.1 class I SAM-dependent methyltransferase [Vallitalea sp.]